MCCLFGIIDYENFFTARQKEKIVKVLSAECEQRGIDATGIAYIDENRNNIKIYKKPLPAHKMRFKFKCNPKVIMGHTRMTTQGNEKFNFNNHPFYSEKLDFALAHNGIIYNDKDLRKKEKLPKTKIQTDTYIAVQLIDKKNTLDFDSLKFMAEKVEGSFCFTVLNNKNEMFIVKGNNPMAVYNFGKFYIYASTKEILNKALNKLKIKSHYNELKINCGDIIKIKSIGKIEKDTFDTISIDLLEYQYLRGYEFGCIDDYSLFKKDKKEPNFEKEYYNYIIDFAKSIGVSETEVNYLLDIGYDYADIEDLLYDPKILKHYLCDVNADGHLD